MRKYVGVVGLVFLALTIFLATRVSVEDSFYLVSGDRTCYKIDRIENDFKLSFCLSKETQKPLAPVESFIGSNQQSPYRYGVEYNIVFKPIIVKPIIITYMREEASSINELRAQMTKNGTRSQDFEKVLKETLSN